MKRLYIPTDESELVFLKSLFEAEGIPYFVLNDNFGSLYSGVYMNNFNAKTIMVPEEFYEDAKGLIQSVLEDAQFEDGRGTGDGEGGPGGILDFLSFKWLFPKSGQDKK
jgi:putative signal transducing protein